MIVESDGYKTETIQQVSLNVSTVQQVNASLAPASATESVTVTGQSPLLQTEGAQLSQTVDAQSLRELPFANRNVQAAAALLPGVTPPVQSFTQIGRAHV